VVAAHAGPQETHRIRLAGKAVSVPQPGPRVKGADGGGVGEGTMRPVVEQAAPNFGGLLRQLRADAGLTQEHPMIKTIKDIDVKGKRIAMRVDFNVPMKDGKVQDDTRITAAIPSIQYLLDHGAKTITLFSHLGDPKKDAKKAKEKAEKDGKVFDEAKYIAGKHRLAPVAEYLAGKLGKPVVFGGEDGDFGKKAFIDGQKDGTVILLENTRFHKEETSDDPAERDKLAKELATYGDIFVNDAFGTAHRAEASTHAVAAAAPVACAGLLLAAELAALGKALPHPAHPLVAIVAGSKVSTKLTILESLADKVDQLIVGGGIANTFLLAEGRAIGKSLAEPDLVEQARTVIAKIRARGGNVPLPTDVVCATEFAESASATTKNVADVTSDDMILDIGPDSAAELAKIVAQAGTVVWNGPVGVFEFEQFSHGTRALAQAIGDSAAFSIAGGGDTLAAIAQFGITDKISYISTGGGAFLEFLEGKELPAVAILEQRARD